MKPSKITRLYLCSALLGLFAGQLPIVTDMMILIFLISAVILIPKKNIFLGIIITCTLSSFYSLSYKKSIEKHRITPLPKEEMHIQAVVLNYGQKKKNKTLYHLKILKINNVYSNGFLLLEEQKKSGLSPGEQIQFRGKAKTIKNFNNFDYKKYLWQFRISGIIKPTSDIKIIHGAPWIKKIPGKVRSYTEKNISKTLPNPHAQIATGMTIGVKEDFDEVTSLQIKNSGLQHLIVVSGSNVTLLVLLLTFIFRRFGPYVFGIISIFFICLFWLIVGPDPPVNRAIVFGIITSIALIIGRKTDSRNLLLITACFFGFLNPNILQSSVSFQLTFIATLGIICFSPVVFRCLKGKIPNKINLLLSIVISAQISVLPLIIFSFGSFPLGGFVSNLIIEPLVPLIMINTALIGLFGEIPIVNQILGFFAFYQISLLLFLAKFFSHFGVMQLPKITNIFLFIVQFGILLWTFFSAKYETKFLYPFQSKLDL